MSITMTPVYRKVPGGYIGFVEELPGANTQAATMEETEENLKEAVDLVIEANLTLATECTAAEEICESALNEMIGSNLEKQRNEGPEFFCHIHESSTIC